MCAFLSHVAPHGTLPACSLLEDDPLSLRADQDWISEARQLVAHHGDDRVPANIWLFVAADMGCGPAAVAFASTAMPQPRNQMPMKKSAGDELMPLTETHVNRQSRLQLV